MGFLVSQHQTHGVPLGSDLHSAFSKSSRAKHKTSKIQETE